MNTQREPPGEDPPFKQDMPQARADPDAFTIVEAGPAGRPRPLQPADAGNDFLVINQHPEFIG
jgi:hypothetical protein